MKRSFSQLDTSTQDVVTFCERHKIQYLPIKLNVVTVTSSDGTKAVKKELQQDIFGFPKAMIRFQCVHTNRKKWSITLPRQ